MCVYLCCKLLASCHFLYQHPSRHFQTHKRSWNERELGHGSRWVTKPRATLLTRPREQFTAQDIALPNLWIRGPTILTGFLFAFLEESVHNRAGSKVEQGTKDHTQPAHSQSARITYRYSQRDPCCYHKLQLGSRLQFPILFECLSSNTPLHTPLWRIVSAITCACNQPNVLVVQHT